MSTKTESMLIDGSKITLSNGSHDFWKDGVCVTECVCPVIALFLGTWNDDLHDDETRGRLIGPLLSRVIGTTTTKAEQIARGWLVIDWSIRVSLPSWLELTESLRPQAAALRALDSVTSETIAAARSALASARLAACLAVGPEAESVAYPTAYSEALSEALSEARTAALSAACLAAGSATESVARLAIYLATLSASDSALVSVVDFLQKSAAELIVTLCEV